MALKRVTLDDGNTMALCPEHRKTVAEHIVSEVGREQGGAWKCRVCTITRRLAHEPADAVTIYIDGHMVTKFPAGNFYCDCASWKFQRAPAAQRTCRHTERFNA